MITENSIINWLKLHCKIQPDTEILINECYVELWAVILNTIICAHNINPKNILCTIRYLLSIEKLFSCFQCAKILCFFGFKNFDDFFNINGWREEELGNSPYRQTTSVFSYYILKSAILFNLTMFLDFCKSGKLTKDLITFKQTEENLNNFFDIIVNCLSDEDYQNNVNFYMELIKNNNDNSFIFNTLRMTAIEQKL